MQNFISFILVIILSTSISFANGIGIVDGSTGVYLQILETNTTVSVKDQIAITTITQIFKNNTGSPVNFKYGIPINENANPTNLRWKYNNVWKEAVVSSLPQDNSIPGGGGVGGNDLEQALVDYLGSSPLFFPPNDTIAVDSTITIELTYVELLSYFQGKVTFFQKGNLNGLQNEIINRQSLTLILDSEKEMLAIDLLGLSYQLQEIDSTTNMLSFSIDEAVSDFDYTIEYELSSDALGINSLSTFIPDSLFNCDTLGSGYFSFIIEPESNVNTEVIEKNFSLIIDRSGSMSGDKILQAKEAATYIVQNLNIGDNFNIIDFDNQVTSFSEGLVEYNVENENDALAYIDNIQSGGSTNISEALITSINQFSVVQEDKANIIIFCTDGKATAGETSTPGILELVRSEVSATEKKVFIFTIGIGENLDQALLTLLARENSGLVQFIEPESLQEDLVRFFLSVNNPVLLNTSISIEPDIINEIYPFPYPNLYKGQQLILTGRYDQAEDLEITLEGEAFNLPVTYNFQVSLADTTNNQLSFLPKIWAKQKLDALSIDFYLAETEAMQDSISILIDSLSSCYGVIAVEFSSFGDGSIVGTEEEFFDQLEKNITAYPNPFIDQVTIEIASLNDVSKPISISLLNTLAKEIKNYTIMMDNGKIFIPELGNLHPGMYFVSFEIDQIKYVIKIVKK